MKIFVAFFVIIFLYPVIFIFGLDSSFGGVVFVLYKILLYMVMFIFFLYPFFRAFLSYKNKKNVQVAMFLLVGVLMPLVSGIFGVFLLEVLGLNKKIFAES